MSKINDLIKKMCPDGVRFDKLENVALLQAGDRITTAMMSDDFEYDVIGGGTLPTGKYNDYNREHCITISRAGSAGYVNWMENKFWATDVCFTAIKNNDYMNIKFIYHYLKNAQKDLQQHIYGGSMPKLEKLFLWKYPIPIPPLAVQEEIVRILDKFGELEAKLEAELEARKSQYEFWRDSLLNNDKYKSVKINDIAYNVSSGKCNSRNENGLYPVYGSTGIIAKTNDYLYETEKILIARVGANAGFVHIAKEKYNVTDNALILDLKDNVDLRFVYYYLQNYNLNKLAKGGGQPLITGGQIKNLDIYLPPLQEQKRISNILNKFDKLINDITDGLPAEIELRKQQYEFYRNKLLSFEVNNEKV